MKQTQQQRDVSTKQINCSQARVLFVCAHAVCAALVLPIFHQGELRSELARLKKGRAQGSPGGLTPPGRIEHRVAPNLPLKEAHTPLYTLQFLQGGMRLIKRVLKELHKLINIMNFCVNAKRAMQHVCVAYMQSCTNMWWCEQNKERCRQTDKHTKQINCFSKSFVCVCMCCLRCAAFCHFSHQEELRSEAAHL